MDPQLLNWFAILAFILGAFALVLEMFVFPGFGVSGLAGIVLLAWGVLLLAVDFTQATGALTIALACTIIIFFVLLRLFNKLNWWQRLTLGTRQQKDTGYVAPQTDLIRFVGATGVSISPLRPAGSVEVDGIRLDVVTEGDFLPPNTPVVIIKVEGTRVIVRRSTFVG